MSVFSRGDIDVHLRQTGCARRACTVAVWIAVLLLGPAPDAAAQAPLPRHAIHSMEVPGGVASALLAAGSTADPERARFVVELARRFYNSPKSADERDEAGPLPALIAHMEAFSRAREATARLDRDGRGLSLATAREKAGHDAFRLWARALGMELKGGRKQPRLELPKGKDAFALRLVLRSAGLETSDVARRLNAGETVVVAIPFERVPLPLAPEIWTSLLLERPVSAEALVAAILSSRPAAVMYAGLLALDDATRAWLVERPELLRWMKGRPGVFLVAAAGLRVSSGTVQVPGGDAARPVWEALADESMRDAERFVRRVLSKDDGRLAYFLSALAALPEGPRAAALAAHDARASSRVEQVKALYGSLDAATSDWDREARPFWRPAVDPVSLLLTLRPSPRHPSGLSGSERFWREVFDADALVPSARDVTRATNDDEAPTLGWLARQIFEADRQDRRPRADQVMYAARHADALADAPVADAMMTLRAVRRVPALVRSLERAGVHDPTLIAALARRADQLLAIGDDGRAQIALMQWQGALAAVLAARDDGGLPLDRTAVLLRELAETAPGEDDRFRGRVLARARTWAPLPDESDAIEQRPVERAWRAWVAGAGRAEVVRAEWEGTTYTVDVPGTLQARQEKQLTAGARPYLDLAHRIAVVATTLAGPGVTVDQARAAQATLTPWAALLPPKKDGDVVDREIQDQWRDALGDLRKVQRPRDLDRLRDVASSLARVSDALLARGLVELAYVRVFAQHEGTPLGPEDAARRHEFGLVRGGDLRRTLPWSLPEVVTTAPGWHVEGALLALDVTLSESALRRTSTQPLAQAPSLNAGDRDTLVDSMVVMPRHGLTDADRDAIATALRRGRERAQSAADAATRAGLARQAGMDATRASLWDWVVTEEPTRAATWLSPREWLFAGLEGQPVPEAWHAWGTSMQAADGCLCTRIVGPLPWDAYAGRMGNTLVAVAVPDLPLRVVEHLADMQLPALLARDVMSVATRDVVDEARAQHQDDWRALIDRIHRLDRDRFEQYLALFTVDGPLRPVEVSEEGSR